jgi:hypothetical protein
MGGTVEDTSRSLSLQKQGLYATIRALGSLHSVAPFGCARGRLYRPRWRWYYNHFPARRDCLKALNPKELQCLFFISTPTILQSNHK